MSLVLALFGGRVQSQGAGGQIGLTWLPNTEPDLAGYRVYYGTVSGYYPNVIDVGNHTSVTVSNLELGVRYYFVVTAYDRAGNESLPSEEVSWVAGMREAVPNALALLENYPNPFAERTEFELNVPQRGRVTVEVYDLRGRRVRLIHDATLPAGRHVLAWDALDDRGGPVPAGVYLIVAHSPNRVTARKVMLLRAGPNR